LIEAAMDGERTFSCGNSKYYVTTHDGYLDVRRQDWFTRTFIGYAADLAQAMELIKRDAKSYQIRAA
jgi:hypothetical protein